MSNDYHKEINVSVIIPTLNEAEVIEPLLKSLVPQLHKNDEIIIVDSGSTDVTLDIVKKYHCRILKTKKEGVGLARTRGAKIAKNDYVAFLDADSIVSEDWLSRIRKHFKDGHHAVGGLDLYYSDSKLHKHIYNAYSFLVHTASRGFHFVTRKYWIPSNNSAFNKQIFLSAGGYRSVVCEDVDIMKRLPPSRVKFDPNLKVHLSDRRFKEEGFMRTLATWVVADVKGMFGKGMDVLNGYTKD